MSIIEAIREAALKDGVNEEALENAINRVFTLSTFPFQRTTKPFYETKSGQN